MYSRLALRSPESDTDIENDLSSEAADSTGRCRCNQIAVDAVKELCGRCSGLGLGGGNVLGKAGGRCCDCLDRCMDSPIVERVAVIGKKIAFIGKTFLMMTDQYLDGGVMVSLHHHGFSSLAVIMAISVVSPQVIAWVFLKANGKESMVGLLVTLLFPSVSAAIFLTLWCTGTTAPILQDVATFLVVVSAQPLRQLRHNLQKNKETDESVWTSVAEGLVEAPASAAITLYVAMLVSLTAHQGATPLFVISVVFSLVMITLKSTALHFYGMEPSILEHMQVLLLQKFPQVASQVLGFVLVAFLTRPLPSDDEDIERSIRTSSQFSLALPLLALELSLNFSLLRTASPQMSVPETLIFATTMAVSSPPGFLSVLDAARPGHAIQHLLCWILMSCVAYRDASNALWTVLKEQYLPFVLLFVIALPAAFVAAIVMSCRPTLSLSERLQRASRRLDEALMTEDRIMARLMVNVEGAEVHPGFLISPEVTFVQIPDGKGQGRAKWFEVCAWGEKLFFGPRHNSEIMILDAATSEVTFVEIPEGKGQGRNKWQGMCALGGKLYFCPSYSGEIMILDAATGEVTFVEIPEGKGRGETQTEKWTGVCALGNKLYFCPRNSKEIMIHDAATGAVTFVEIPEGKGQAFNDWHGVCTLGTKVYFCPYRNSDIMILDAATGEVTFVENPDGKGQGNAIDANYTDVCALGQKLYFCPCDSAEIMILDAVTREVTLVEIPDGKGQGHTKWLGVCALGDKVYFCPSHSTEIMILDTVTGDVNLVEIPDGKGQAHDKWIGLCALGEKVYFCPCDSGEIMSLNLAGCISRRERCEAVGLTVHGWQNQSLISS